VQFDFSGCLSEKLKKNLAKVEIMIEKDDTAMAGFMEKLKNVMASGIATPPPPIPATLLRHMMSENTNVPTISLFSSGKSGLWMHSFYLPSSYYSSTGMQMKY